MQQFAVVLDQLIGFAIMLVIGYICIRCKVYGQKALDGICQLILKVGIPLMVFSNATAGATRADLFDSGIILVFQAVMYVLLISSTWLIAKVMRLQVNRGHMFQAAFIFGNVGFIGLPLLIALFPERGALFYSLMALLDQLLMWTYGVWLTRSEQTRRERPAASLVHSAAARIAEPRAGVGGRVAAGHPDRHPDPRGYQHAAAHGRLDLHAVVADVHRRPVRVA